VQAIGVCLLVFSVVSAVGESWFHFALYSYLAHNATLSISGMTVHLPPLHRVEIGGSPFGSPFFFCGLLVLALSEVFRQGLVLKRENDLTV
jgi:hypothetical protein